MCGASSQFSDMYLQPGPSPGFQTPVSTCALHLAAGLTWHSWVHKSKLEPSIFLPKAAHPLPCLSYFRKGHLHSPPCPHYIPPLCSVSSSFQICLESTLTSHQHGMGSGLPDPSGLLDSVLTSSFSVLKGSHSNIFKMPIRSGHLRAQSPSMYCSDSKGGARKG